MNNNALITYISNAGVLINYNNKKILIDGIHTKLTKPFPTVPLNVINNIKKSISPFDNLDLLLFTHDHTDHFSSKETVDILLNNPKTKILSTQAVINKIKSEPLFNSDFNKRLISVDLLKNEKKEVILEGIQINCYSTIHDGTLYSDVKNLTFLINIKGKTFLHLGDSKPNKHTLENLDLIKKEIDVAFLNFPFLTLRTGRTTLSECIKPKKVVLIHLPLKEFDRFNWYKATIEAYENNKHLLPPTIICDLLMHTFNI